MYFEWLAASGTREYAIFALSCSNVSSYSQWSMAMATVCVLYIMCWTDGSLTIDGSVARLLVVCVCVCVCV